MSAAGAAVAAPDRVLGVEPWREGGDAAGEPHDEAKLHQTDKEVVSAGGLIRRRRDDELVTRAELEAGLDRLFERLSAREDELGAAAEVPEAAAKTRLI